MRSRHWRCCAVAVLLFGCARELPPAAEQDVLDALAKDFLLPMGDVLVASWPSDCRTDGETNAPVQAALFAAFLVANEHNDGAGLPRQALAARLRVDPSGLPPRTVSAQHRAPVVAFSRVGLLGDDALVCVEVFGVQERAFFVLLRRDAVGLWSVRTELEVWAELPPEELPDGELYR